MVTAAMLIGGVLGSTVLAKSALSAVNAATSPAPLATPRSNEASTHEAGETPAREAAEISGTAHFGRPGSRPSSETAVHEAGELATREAAEKT